MALPGFEPGFAESKSAGITKLPYKAMKKVKEAGFAPASLGLESNMLVYYTIPP
jgi:hypothetical protein